jgi:hypothetical protein
LILDSANLHPSVPAATPFFPAASGSSRSKKGVATVPSPGATGRIEAPISAASQQEEGETTMSNIPTHTANKAKAD